MEQQVPWEQLVKYFAGELTRKENRKMETWINADPQREQQVRRLYEIWQESGTPPYQLDIEEAWDSLSAGMDKLEKKAQKTGPKSSADHKVRRVSSVLRDDERQIRRSNTPRRFMMAAAAVILLAVGLFAYYSNFKSGENTHIGIRELVAEKGERATYILNDSSRIILHAGSRIEVPTDFNIDKRELYLDGEAYFEVTPDPEKPFTVHSREAYTKVLGTKFLVQSWSESQRVIEVVVSEGKVVLGDSRSNNTGNKEAIITRNQKGVLIGNNDPEVTDNVDLEWYLGWTQGRLVFDNQPLSEIIPRLERWYDVEIKTANKEIASKKLTAEIDYRQSMREVLRNMALSLGLTLEQEGGVVILDLKK